MDLAFNRRRISSNALRDLADEVRERFGQFTKYIVHLEFKKTDNWDIFKYPFIFDTGAVLSYAPISILEDLSIEPEFELKVGGIHPDDRCKVITKVAKVSFKIIDDVNLESQELNAWFAFHPFIQRTFLLGMKNALENFNFQHKVEEGRLIITL